MLLDPIESKPDFCPECVEVLDEDGLCPNDCDMAESMLGDNWYEEGDDYGEDAELDYYEDDFEEVVAGLDYFYEVDSTE